MQRPTLIIPVENQVRELDPKLLLACVAASRGYPCIIGSRRDVELDIDLYPRGIFLSKSMTIRSLLMFHVTRVLGHEVVTWDEEALVHLPPDEYYPRRLHPLAMRYISHLFAWGEDNAALWRAYPRMPKGLPIHVTGNPRSDLLRPDVRRYYDGEAAALRKEHGNFVLVNTNFNHVNAFFAKLNLFLPASKPGKARKFGRGARGMTREFAEALHVHKQAIFEAFQELIPALSAEFPDYRIVVRPHPTEKHDVYRAIAEHCPNVRVTNVGNVVPWLMATRALVHNGCTTGVEAYALGVPCISYRPKIDERIDDAFYRLSNALSLQCLTQEKLLETLRGILSGAPASLDGAARTALFKQALAGLEGETASARIVDVLDGIDPEAVPARARGPLGRFERELVRFGLKVVRRYRTHLPGDQNSPEFQRHRYPGARLDELRERVARWQAVLGDPVPLNVEQVAEHIFRIAC